MTLTNPLTRSFDGLASRVDATGFRSLGFTSTLAGEGVSTIALGTALSLVELRNEAVLLVDANWIQPSLTEDAHLVSAPGLADCLAGATNVASAIRSGSGSRPAFLPIGDRTAARPTLRSLASLLTGDLAVYATVIVDLPPMLAGESFVRPWAALLDQVLVVLREASTPLPQVREALGKLGNATNAQLVLNRTMPPRGKAAPAFLAVRT
jgi:Mrp family chromosome partitioning ATPase